MFAFLAFRPLGFSGFLASPSSWLLGFAASRLFALAASRLLGFWAFKLLGFSFFLAFFIAGWLLVFWAFWLLGLSCFLAFSLASWLLPPLSPICEAIRAYGPSLQHGKVVWIILVANGGAAAPQHPQPPPLFQSHPCLPQEIPVVPPKAG